jgi:3-deoxy-manno-octulosonate cytidylyltransferase (CMP-KDO synthetase)
VSFKVVVPARYASERLPAKALRDVAGVPLVVRALHQARRSAATEVLVATDHVEIEAAVAAAGGRAMLTSAAHQSGTERIAEVARRCGWPPETIVVNVQGDEPMMPPQLIDQCAALLDDASADMATLCHAIDDPADMKRPEVVKVVRNRAGFALYFSRAPIPFDRTPWCHGPGAAVGQRHIGIYAYRVAALLTLADAPSPQLEDRERLEQLRALWLGMRIRVASAVTMPGPGVDTEADLARVVALLESGQGPS